MPVVPTPESITSALGPFPVLQMVVAGLIALAAIYMMLRGTQAGRSTPPPEPPPQGTVVYYTGPIGAALKYLAKMVALLEEIRDELRELRRHRRH